jgi:anti-sigma regulatory factor (Ser/Thr protein kinase)
LGTPDSMTNAYFFDTKSVPGWEHALTDYPQLSDLRREIRFALAPRLHGTELSDVLLVLTELVTNSYCHTDDPIWAEIAITDAGVLVGVSDGNTADLRLQPPSAVRSHGRGLALVSAIADDWGVESTQDGHGKTVWALLPKAV